MRLVVARRHLQEEGQHGPVILVDDPLWPWRGRRWCHLVSDLSHAELHAFALQLGVPRHVFQGDHYDLPEEHRARAVEQGAAEVGSRELVRRLRAAGLRRTPARGHPPLG
ncbi:MAG: DUF4031 domain-containing protein [Acidimicrobiales bacterium]